MQKIILNSDVCCFRVVDFFKSFHSCFKPRLMVAMYLTDIFLAFNVEGHLWMFLSDKLSVIEVVI